MGRWQDFFGLQVATGVSQKTGAGGGHGAGAAVMHGVGALQDGALWWKRPEVTVRAVSRTSWCIGSNSQFRTTVQVKV